MPFGGHARPGPGVAEPRPPRTAGPGAPGASSAPGAAARDPRIDVLLDWCAARGEPGTVLGVCAATDPLVTGLATAVRERGVLPCAHACFVEDDPTRAAAAAAVLGPVRGLPVSIVHGDVGLSDSYVGRVPVDLVLLGPAVVDGPLIRRRGLAEALPALLAPGGRLIWWSQAGQLLAAWTRTLSAVGLAHETTGPDWGRARLVDRPRRLCDGMRLYPAR